MPYPLPLTRTEAYLAYKAGVIQQSDLKPSLAVSRNGIDAWLAYWTGLTKKFPIKGITKNLWEWNKYDEYSVTNRTTYEIDGDNNLVVSTTSGSYQNVTFLVELEDGEYTFSLGSVTNTNPSMTVKRMTLATRNSDGSGRTVVQQVSAGTPRTVTITNEPNKIYTLEFWGTDGTSLNNTATYSQVQIEKGDEATSYEPYTGEPEMLTEEEAFIAYLSGVINEYPEKCLRRVGAYLRYLISARWGRPDHPLNREELYLSLIKTQFIPSGDPSSDIVIDGTTKAPFQDVKMYGDTFQQTYTGKNLYNNEAIPYVAKRAYGSDGAVLSWTDYVGTNEYQPVEPNTQYSLWNNKISNTTYLCEYDEDKNFIQRLIAVKQFTTTSTTKYLRWSLNVGAGEIPPTRTQLELGSPTSYEPYVGEQPSPSPSYPQQIQTVTGAQTVKVNGKNMFNSVIEIGGIGAGGYRLNNSERFNSRTEIPVSGSTTYTLSATPKIEDATINIVVQTWNSSGQVIEQLPGIYFTEVPFTFTTPETCTKITISGKYSDNTDFGTVGDTTDYIQNVQLELGSNASSYEPYQVDSYDINLNCNIYDRDLAYMSGNDMQIPINITPGSSYYYGATTRWVGAYLYDASGTLVRTVGHTATTRSGEFTAASNEVKAVFTFYAGQDATWSWSGVEFYDLAGVIELCKIGTYQDYIWKDGDDWKVHKAIVKSVFTGAESENWSISQPSRMDIDVYGAVRGSASSNPILSNMYVQRFEIYDGSIFLSGANDWISVVDTTNATSVEAWKTFLGSNNLTAYYAIKNPTDNTITNQTLIAQLEALVNGGAEEGATHIKVNATDPNLPGLLYVEAPKYD